MDKLVNLTTQDGVAVITIDNPPVNALEPRVCPEGLVAALDRRVSKRSVGPRRGAHRRRARFIAGADIKVWSSRRARTG